jgi:hypothetical protein
MEIIKGTFQKRKKEEERNWGEGGGGGIYIFPVAEEGTGVGDESSSKREAATEGRCHPRPR